MRDETATSIGACISARGSDPAGLLDSVATNPRLWWVAATIEWRNTQSPQACRDADDFIAAAAIVEKLQREAAARYKRNPPSIPEYWWTKT